ncbi:MAG: FAD-dependent oxidoreductase [Nocardioides sp.]
MSTDSEYTPLLEPLSIGPMRLANRIMMAPMERNYAHADGTVSPRTLAHYRERAAGAVGWIDVEATFVSPEGRGRVHQLGLHDEAMVPGFARLVDTCHAHGTTVSVELHHAGRHAARQITGHRPVAPSALPSPESDGMLCVPLDAEGVQAVLSAYGNAARRAISAGVDAVELHGAHGYLVHQFLSALTNRRTDAFGGSRQKRQEFAVRAVAALRDAVGSKQIAVGCRLSVTEALPGGFEEDFIAELGVRLVNEGVDYISLNAGAIESPLAISPPMGTGSDGWLAPAAQRLRAEWKIPVVLAGRFLSLRTGAEALRQGAADVVAYGRALLADPHMVSKTLAGQVADVTPCVGCNQGCVARIGQQLDATCTVNPRMGRELHDVDLEASRSVSRRQCLVVAGGGPAGMVAALEADSRGFDVQLYEASSSLGGSLRHCAVEPDRDGWSRYLEHLRSRIEASAIKWHLDTPVEKGLERGPGGDVLIIATGAQYIVPPSLRLTAPTCLVLAPDEAIESPDRVGRRCVIVGGDATAVGTAIALRRAGAQVVALIGSPPTTRTLGGLEFALEELRDADCEVLTDMEIVGVARSLIRVAPAGTIDAAECRTFAEIDSIVIAAPRGPRLPQMLTTHVRSSAFTESHRIGDAASPGDVRDAVADAYQLIRDLCHRPRQAAGHVHI